MSDFIHFKNTLVNLPLCKKPKNYWIWLSSCTSTTIYCTYACWCIKYVNTMQSSSFRHKPQLSHLSLSATVAWPTAKTQLKLLPHWLNTNRFSLCLMLLPHVHLSVALTKAFDCQNPHTLSPVQYSAFFKFCPLLIFFEAHSKHISAPHRRAALLQCVIFLQYFYLDRPVSVLDSLSGEKEIYANPEKWTKKISRARVFALNSNPRHMQCKHKLAMTFLCPFNCAE